MADEQEVVLVSFGPTQEVPKGHCWCMNCDGSGQSWEGISDEQVTCKVCQGKGYWNREDIRQYHLLVPDICRQTCGAKHLDIEISPDFEKIKKLEVILLDIERSRKTKSESSD